MKIDLDKETLEMVLMELLNLFSSYVGKKEGLKNIELADVYNIEEEDWEYINMPWFQIKPYKNAYDMIVKQVKK